MQYLAKFNNEGMRETSVVEGIHFKTKEEKQKYLDAGYIEITNEEQILYASNEYIRGLGGNPQKKPPHLPTTEQLQESLTTTVQNFLDTKVKERGYNDFLFVNTYVNSTNPLWQAEALACIAWRDSVWQTYYNILNEVILGQREIPTAEKLLAELPKLTWPK